MGYSDIFQNNLLSLPPTRMWDAVEGESALVDPQISRTECNYFPNSIIKQLHPLIIEISP